MRNRLLAAATFAALIAASAPAEPAGGAPAPADLRPVDAANTVVIDTNKGRIVVELYPSIAPQSVARLLTLARQHFYDGQTFFRVIDGFMDQTGDPLNSGQGQSNLPNVPAEFDFRYAPNQGVSEVTSIPQGSIGFVGALPVVGQPDAMADLTADGKVHGFALFCPGVIGMARAQAPDSANSQFFLMRAEHLDLNQRYTAFGRVIVGQDVVRENQGGRTGRRSQGRHEHSPGAGRHARRQLAPTCASRTPRAPPSGARIAALRAVKKDDFDPCTVDLAVTGQ